MIDVASFFGTWTVPFVASSIPYLFSEIADFPTLRKRIKVFTKNPKIISAIEFFAISILGAAITIYIIRPPNLGATFVAAIAWPGSLSQLLRSNKLQAEEQGHDAV